MSRDRIMQLLGLAVGLALALPVGGGQATDAASADTVPGSADSVIEAPIDP